MNALLRPSLLTYIGVYLALVLGAAVIEAPAIFAVFLIGAWSMIVVARVFALGPVTEVDPVFVVWLAAFQNVFLGMASPYLSPSHVRLLVGVNFMAATTWVVLATVQRGRGFLSRGSQWVSLAPLTIVAVIASSIAVFGFNGLAAVASIRNILTPALFFTLGWLIGWGRPDPATRRRYLSAVATIGVLVVIVGVVERFLAPGMWIELNVGDLWQKKGLTNLAGSGVPQNWWSAERIGGEQIRRMISTFADPVNLGTFLMLMMLSGYGLKRPAIMILALLGIVLTVSKGGFLGCLVLIVVHAYYRWTRVGFFAAGGVALMAGLAFIGYSLRYATGSLLLHMAGAAFAIRGLTDYPLGRGVGRVGTIAQQFVDLGEQEILESGLGMIAGQLGLPGLGVYLLFMGLILYCVSKTPDVRERVVAVVAFWSISLNIVFNEVALSPNSSAGYFVLLGMVVAGTRRVQLRSSLEEVAARSLPAPVGG